MRKNKSKSDKMIESENKSNEVIKIEMRVRNKL